ncbi:inter-alpha-trypsin inhibitor heavy chain H3-like isoform X2 [Amblyraja radiata]|uniref:inter-alpha-trypsin inhibitor heavy chain H3-like isoform X2 n=1 Tax=Amblyraja radiata TaxID=386614 RepID=UPI001402AE15|nr:inter-alpha-trypsin inhibitor heavy chain H3-like isoform X2 [Amblyraja radiata]
MKTMLSFLLLISIPILISSEFILTESEQPQNNYVDPRTNILRPRTLKKRSIDTHGTEPLRELEIYGMKIDSKVTSRFAHNVIISRVVNRANVSKEAFFEIELPKTAFISNFSMTLDGVTYVGIVKEKEAAQKQYQQAVSRGQTAGLVQVSGRKMEKFKVSVNIGSTKKVTFELTYEELLKRNLGKYEMNIRVNPKQLVKHFQIDVHIFEPQGISFLDVNSTFQMNDLTSLVKKTLSGTKAHISFKPTLEQQRKCPDCHDTALNGDFFVYYDVNRDLSAGSIQIVNGYFVHHFAPANLTKIPKNVVFVIDHSGSMSGKKMHQTNEALLKILADMHEQDHFAIIIFDNVHSIWKDTVFQATPEKVAEAKKFVRTISASGGTNINSPMLEAVQLLDKAHRDKQLPERSVSMIILLTDGDPNRGESNPSKIQENVKNAVREKYNVYALGFGYNVKFSFLEKMALENNGIARRIYEDSDAPLQLQGFYDEVANPLLLDIEILYPENAVSDLTQASFRQYYDGSEIVVAGRISDNSLQILTAEVNAQTAKGNLTLSADVNIMQQQQYIFGDFTERLWAYLTIQQLLDQRVSARADDKKNLTDEILSLSLKYNFVTSLTSMVVTKPEDTKDKIFVADKPSDDARPERQRYYAPPASVPSSSYTYVDSDPHFVISTNNHRDAVCFNIDGKPGSVLNLISDPHTGFVVNGQVIGYKNVEKNNKLSTYFGKFGIVNSNMDVKMEISTQVITVFHGEDKMVFPWSATTSVTKQSFSISIVKERNLTLVMGDEATFVIVLHRVWKYPLHRDFLGFYTLDSHRLSNMTHGLLGQFYHGVNAEVYDMRPSLDQGKPHATMDVKGHKLRVTRGSQKDHRLNLKQGTKVSCWFVHDNGKGFIDGIPTDYVVPSLFDYFYPSGEMGW